MKNAYFQSVEQLSSGTVLPLAEVIAELVFNEQGLIPAVTQDATTKEVLMVAWMNKNALEITLATGYMTYWSRSRNALWKKGETSGHTQELVSVSFDCDGDTILCQVNQKGAACHTGRPDCFYLSVDREHKQVTLKTTA